MVSLAGVERIPLSLRLHAQLYSNLQYLTPLSRRRLLTDGTQKTLCSQYCGKTKQTCRNVNIWSSGECNEWQVSRHKPLDTTPPSFRETGQQGDLLANLMQHVFTYSWFETTWNYPTWGKFSFFTFVFYCFSTLVIN